MREPHPVSSSATGFRRRPCRWALAAALAGLSWLAAPGFAAANGLSGERVADLDDDTGRHSATMAASQTSQSSLDFQPSTAPRDELGEKFGLGACGETLPGCERASGSDSALETPRRTSGSPAVFRLDSLPDSWLSPTGDWHHRLLEAQDIGLYLAQVGPLGRSEERWTFGPTGFDRQRPGRALVVMNGATTVAEKQCYEYDVHGRLVNVTRAGADGGCGTGDDTTTDYTYDDADNRTEKDVQTFP